MRDRRTWLGLVLLVALTVAACGGGSDDGTATDDGTGAGSGGEDVAGAETTTDDTTDDEPTDNDAIDDDAIDDEATAEIGGDGTGADGSAGGDTADDGTGDEGPPADDDDDAADLVGDPDLDLDELEDVAPDAADALDDIDDVVSIGECRSAFLGLEMTVIPDGWECRVLGQPLAGADGFTLFQPGAPGFEITITSPSATGPPCEALQICDSAEPIDLGSTFDTTIVDPRHSHRPRDPPIG